MAADVDEQLGARNPLVERLRRRSLEQVALDPERAAGVLEVGPLLRGRARKLLDEEHVEAEPLEPADEADPRPGVAAVAGLGGQGATHQRGRHQPAPASARATASP